MQYILKNTLHMYPEIADNLQKGALALYISEEEYPMSGYKIWESSETQGRPCINLPDGEYHLRFEGKYTVEQEIFAT